MATVKHTNKQQKPTGNKVLVSIWKIGTIVHFVGAVTMHQWCSHYGKYYAVPQKIKTKATI